MAADDTQRLLILVEAQTTQVNKALKKLEQDTARTTARVRRDLDQIGTAGLAGVEKRVSAGIGSTIKAFAGVFAAQQIVGFIGNTIEAMDELGDAAQRLGVSAEQLQKWQIAAEDLGGSAEDVAPALDFLSKQIGKAAGGDKGATKIFEQLGISIRDSEGHVRSLAEVFNDVADAVAALGSEEERIAAIASTMGRGATGLATVFAHGSASIEAMGDAAEKFGRIWDDEVIRKAGELEKVWRDVTKEAKTEFGKWAILAAHALVDVSTEFDRWLKQMGRDLGVDFLATGSATEEIQKSVKLIDERLQLQREQLRLNDEQLKYGENAEINADDRAAIEEGIAKLLAERVKLLGEEANVVVDIEKSVKKLLPAWTGLRDVAEDILDLLTRMAFTIPTLGDIPDWAAIDPAAVKGMEDAEDFLKRWESAGHSGKPLLKAFFDTDQFRVGFSSDTYVDEMGKVQKTTEQTVVTVEQAMQDLRRRIDEGMDESARLVGEAWADLPDRVKAALATIEYHYGSIANAGHVLAAAQTGDVDKIVDAIGRLDPAGKKYGARYAELVQFIKGGSIEVAEAAAEYEKLTEVEDEKAEADKKATEALAAFNAEMDKHAARITYEKTLLGESIAERERLLEIFDQLAAATEQLGRPLTGEEEQAVIRMVNGYDELARAKENNIIWSDALRQAEEQGRDQRLANLEELKDAWMQLGDVVADAFVSAIVEGEKLQDVIKDLMKTLASMLLRSAVSSIFGMFNPFGGAAGPAGLMVPAGAAMRGSTGAAVPAGVMVSPSVMAARAAMSRALAIPDVKGATARTRELEPVPIRLAVTTTASPYFDTRVAAIGSAVSERHIAVYDQGSMSRLRAREMRGIA